MPYVSKIDKERARWMTLREALTHIGKAEHCSLKAALRQLGGAIADREVDARWPHALHLSGDWDDEDIGPPRDARFWRSARVVLVAGGSILDDPSCRTNHTRLQLIRNGTIHYRPVLISREAVERLWPRLDEGAEASPPTDQIRDREDSSSVSDNEVVSRAIDRKDVDEKVRQLIRELQAEHAHAIPNVNETWDLLKDKLPSGVTRTRLFVLLEEPEFDKRVPRGKRKRKK